MRADRYRTEHKPKKSHKLLKAMLLIIPLLIVAIAGLVFYSYKSAEDSLVVRFSDDSPELEIGSVAKAADYIEESEGDVKASAEYLNTDTAGEKEIVYTVSKSLYGGLLNVSKDFTLKYMVKDDTPPLVLADGNGATVLLGSEFDIKEIVSYGDNADPNPVIEVEGKVDTENAGNYPIHAKLTDASGNKVEWDLNVHVAAEVPTYIYSGEKTAFDSFVKTYKGEGKSFGIDVSAWQNEIDFNKVKDAGCEFVIIRAGYSEDGKVTEDKRFDENLRKAKKAGLKIGLYIYSQDNSESEAGETAKWLMKRLGGETIDLPVAFDWEDFATFQKYEMSFATLNSMYDAFADELSKAGYDTMLYGSKIYLEKVWNDRDTRPIWLAHYIDETNYKGKHFMWQASCTGRINGIDGDVDMDILYEKH